MCESGATLVEFQIGPHEKVRLVRKAAMVEAAPVSAAAVPGASAPSVDSIPASARINAPLSGVFYRAPAPSAPPFVEEGSMVKKGDVICIIEAMKVLNEIKAPRDGKVASVHAQNGKHVKKADLLFVYAD